MPPPQPEHDHRGHAAQDPQAALPAVDPCHQPGAAIGAEIAQIHPQRHADQRRQAVQQQETQEADPVSGPGGDEHRGAHAGQETGDEHEPVAIAFELALHGGIARRRQQPGDQSPLEDARSVMVAEQEHAGIADQDAGQGHPDHAVRVAVAQAGDDAAGDQGDVLRQRQAEPAQQQRDEHRKIAMLGKKDDQGLQQIHRACAWGPTMKPRRR